MRFSLSGGTLVFLGALFWSLNAPLVKFLDVDSLLLCGLRSLIAGIALAIFIRPKRLNWNGWMLMYMISYAALCLSIILALNMTSAPVAIGMQYTATIWLFLVGLVKTKRFVWRSFLPVAIISVGVVFFMCSGSDSTSNTGNFIALFEGIFFACMTVGAKKAAGDNALGLTAVANLFTGLVIFLCFPSSLSKVSALSQQDWIIILILGAVQIGCGYAFYNLGVQRVSPQKASIIALWEMILGPVWVAIFLKEYPSLSVLAGFLIVLVGMFLDAFAHPESKTQDQPSTKDPSVS